MKNPYFSLVKAVWQNGRTWRKTIIGYYLAYIIAQAFMSLAPYAFGRSIDILQHFTPDRFASLIFWLGVGIMIVPIFWLFHGPARVIERKVALQIKETYLLDLYQKLTQLPLKWHQAHHSGDIMTRLNCSSTALRRFAEDQFIYIESIIGFVTSILFLLWIALPVGLLTLIACLVSATVVILFDQKLIALYRSQNKIENHVGAGLFDYISNITTVLTLRLEQLTQKNIFRRFIAIWPFFKKEAVLNEVKWFSMGIVLSVTQYAILIGYILYHLKDTGIVMIGTVVMIFRYQSDLSQVFCDLSVYYSELVRMDTDVKSMQPILEDVEQWGSKAADSPTLATWKLFSIQDLQFTHVNEDDGKSLASINLTIHRGEKIALIGASGSGKTTLLNLLSGLYMPDTVRLTIDNTVFKGLEPLHSITTLIPQEPEIFENTIAFNITMALDEHEAILKRMSELSYFAPVLAELPNGFKTDIREKGLNLSVGQKQRLALARGLFAARFSSFILMDEPTSSVDLATEEKILSGLINHYSEHAMMVSLHRLHLLPKFDRIVMLEQGKIVADGDAQMLLNQAGPVKEFIALTPNMDT